MELRKVKQNKTFTQWTRKKTGSFPCQVLSDKAPKIILISIYVSHIAGNIPYFPKWVQASDFKSMSETCKQISSCLGPLEISSVILLGCFYSSSFRLVDNRACTHITTTMASQEGSSKFQSYTTKRGKICYKKKSERERKKITTPTLEGLVHTTNRTWLKMVIISTLFNMQRLCFKI